MSHVSSPPVPRIDQADTQPAPRATIARFAHSRAVVVGIDRYQHIRPLSTAVSDATRLAEFLRTHHGYDDVMLLENATHTDLATELGERLAERVGSGDRLLLYFAGHGIALDGDEGPEGFLIPADAKETDRSSFVAMADLYGWLEALPCRHLLVILDCCFAGAFTWYGRRSVRPLGAKLFREHYDRFVREPAWQILTSAAHDQEALDVLGGKAIGVRGEQTGNGQRHSPFADALFAALQGEADLIPKGQGDGVVTATELYLYLRQSVEISAEEQARHRQTPELWPFSRSRHGKGEFIFLVPGRGEPVLEPAPELTAANNPYRGLQSYDEKHAALFFGRSALIARLAAAVDERPLTVVLGASGTGKSSIVKAGVVPYLKQRRDAAARDEATAPQGNLPAYVALPPMRPGDAPLRVAAELVAANLLASTPPPAGADPAAFLTETVRGWLAAHPAQRLLLVVDQVEELITLCRDDAVRDAFLQMLAGLLAAHPDRLRVILTLRTDFEPQFFDAPLNGLWKHGRFVTPPMSQAELREVIEEPAAVSVLFFDPPTLVDTLIDEVIQTPGALPLLSFTLEQLYLKYIDRQSQAQRDAVTLERSLLRADYDALGGVIGALRRRADELYLGLPDDAHRATMQRVMLRMVAVEGGELARRRVMRAELDYPTEAENSRVQTVLDRLVVARLLVTGSLDVDGDGVEDTVVEPAHDALVAAWDKLLQWKRQAEEFLPLQRRLWQAAGEWKMAPKERQRGLLWDANPRLPQLEETLWPTRSKEVGLAGRTRWARQVLWPQTDLPDDTQWLNQAEVAFVQTSVKRRASGLRRIIGTATAVMAVIAVLGFSVMSFQQSAVANEVLARTNDVLRKAETGRADANGELAEQERLAKEQEQIAKETERTLRTEVERLKRGIQADQLTGKALNLVDENPPLALLLAAEGIRAQSDYTMTVSVADPVTPQSPDPITHTAIVSETVVGSAQSNVHELLGLVGGVPLAGHSEPVYEVAFSPDGRWLATASWDTTARLWDVTDPTAYPIVLAGHEDNVNDLAFSPDGRWLATATRGSARLWDVTNPRAAPIVLAGHEGWINAVAFSPDGRWLATASGDDTARLWDVTVPNAAPIVLAGHAEDVYAVVFSPDGRWLATITSDNTARLWDVTDPRAAPIVLAGHADAVVAVAFSPDGRWLATASEDATARLWEVTDPSADVLVLTGHAEEIYSVAFSPDGRWLATASGDDTARLWDVTDPGAVPIVLAGHADEVVAVAFSPDGRRLATGSSDNTARLWDVTDPSAVPIVLAGHEGAVNEVAFSPDGRWLATASWDTTARLWDVTVPRAAPAFLAGNAFDIVDMAFSADGRWLATASDNNTARLWDVTDPGAAPIVLAGHESGVNDLAFSPDGRWLATASWDTTARLWDVADLSAAPSVLVGHADDVVAVAFSPDGRWLATASGDDTARLWDVTGSGAAPIVLASHADDVRDVAFSPDGRWLATASYDTTARLWDVTDPSADPIILAGHSDYVLAVAFSPDGRRLATASRDGTARLWDVTDPNADPFVLAGHAGTVNAVAFSPDGRRLATGSYDTTARLWDVTDPSADPIVLAGHAYFVMAVAFNPDGRWLATASYDGTARLWTWRLHDLLAVVCRFAGRNLTVEEWARYFQGTKYRKTCPQWPAHPSVTESLRNEASLLAQQGDVAGAIAKFEEALALDPSLPIAPALLAKIEWGKELFASGAYTEGMVALASTQTVSPTVEITSTLPAKGKDSWNNVCWDGSLDGAASAVMPACERAVTLAPEDGGIRDSRGLARALTDDLEGARRDFEFAVQWAKETGYDEAFIESRTVWIAALKAGNSPFDAAMLEQLRNE